MTVLLETLLLELFLTIIFILTHDLTHEPFKLVTSTHEASLLNVLITSGYLNVSIVAMVSLNLLTALDSMNNVMEKFDVIQIVHGKFLLVIFELYLEMYLSPLIFKSLMLILDGCDSFL